MIFIGLYLGDGFKIEGRVGLGNADPGIVLLFMILLEKLYGVKHDNLHAQVFARADQNVDDVKQYWSDLLGISIDRFHKTQVDRRTMGKKTTDGYRGVCAASVNDILLQRKILAIGKEMIKYVGTLNRARSSVG